MRRPDHHHPNKSYPRLHAFGAIIALGLLAHAGPAMPYQTANIAATPSVARLDPCNNEHDWRQAILDSLDQIGKPLECLEPLDPIDSMEKWFDSFGKCVTENGVPPDTTPEERHEMKSAIQAQSALLDCHPSSVSQATVNAQRANLALLLSLL